MLQRVVCKSGIVFLASPLLRAAGVPHAFSTRLGGVSPAPFDLLNLGNPLDNTARDRAEHIDENYRRLLGAIECPHRAIRRVHQVHGCAALWASADLPPANAPADALLADNPDLLVSVRTADCVPILLSTLDGRLVAAVHAGWRGVIADVLGAALAQFAGRGIAPGQVIAAVGPCIGPDAFEVGPEVADAFRTAFPGEALVHALPEGKARVDLRAAVRCQLIRHGLPEAQIDLTDACTFRDAQDFYSHRRDQGRTGRMAALIGPRRG